MTAFGPLPSIPPGIAASAAGSISTGTAERTAKADAAGHSLAAWQKDLSSHPLDGEANASADRDADGWTGGSESGRPGPDQPPPAASSGPPTRPRLPDDPCGGRLDVTA